MYRLTMIKSARLAGVVGLLGIVFLFPAVAYAHPADQYLQSAYLTLDAEKITVELDLTAGPLIAGGLLAQIDTSKDGEIGQEEASQYAAVVLNHLSLSVNDRPLPLVQTSLEYPTAQAFTAGLGTFKLFAVAAFHSGSDASNYLAFLNTHHPEISAYQVNIFTARAASISLGAPIRDALQRGIEIDYRIGLNFASPTVVAPITSQAAEQPQIIAYLSAPTLPPLALLAALGLAILLGALHALTPGHGKTLMAAYLVGSRGTERHAVALGLVITVSHTASVLAIGMLALIASQSVVPGELLPTLEAVSGLLVVALGLRLVWQRWQSVRTYAPHSHTHGTPDLTSANRLRWLDLFGMGISGGIIPCPEALGILIVAVGLNRIGIGLTLIIAFSAGLAAVLVGIGLILVRSRSLTRRLNWTNGRAGRWLPLLSALLVTTLGVGIVTRGIASLAPDRIAVVAAIAFVLIICAILWQWFARRASSTNKPLSAGLTIDPSELPPRYRNGDPVCTTPMAAADLKFDANGQVAWDEIWTSFCDLALAGGPPHRGTLLEPVSKHEVEADPVSYARVQAEIARGLKMITGLPIKMDGACGWIGLVCHDERMAAWLVRAIIVENVSVRREGSTIYLPVGPGFQLEKEIKNVVTVVAKTHHYWIEHITT